MSYEEFNWRIREGIFDDYGSSPVTPVLEILQVKWRLNVIYYLFQSESARFNEIKFNVEGITSAALSKTLKELEGLGFIDRKDFKQKPPHVEYSLTKKGNDLLPLYYEIMNFGFAYPQK